MEAHNPEGSYQRNAGFSLKAKGSPSRAEAGWGGLGPPTLRDATMSPIPVQPGWVGSGPLAAGRSDTPIPFHGNPPEWGGTRSESVYRYFAGGPTSFRHKGMREVAETQTTPSMQVSRTLPHTAAYRYSA